VIILPHSKKSGDAAAEEIRKASGNPNILSIQTDLSSFEAVRSSVRTLEQMGVDTVTSLICNAGIAMNPGGWGSDAAMLTPDGFNYVLQVNYLSHILLANLLLPKLRAVKGRLVVVASAYEPDGGCAFAKMKKGCTALANVRETLTTPTPGNATYYVSKFLQSLHAAMIAAQERTLSTGVEAFAYAPGVVYTPLAKHLGASWQGGMLGTMRKICRCKGAADEASPNSGCPISTWCLISPDQSASTTVHLATSPASPGLSGSRTSPCAGCGARIRCKFERHAVTSSIRQGAAMGEYLAQLNRATMAVTQTEGAGTGTGTRVTVPVRSANSSSCAVEEPADALKRGSMDSSVTCPARTWPAAGDFVRAGGHGRLTDVRTALKAGQEVDYAVPPKKDTALMLASYFGHKEVVAVLLAAGSSTAKKDIHGANAYAHAKDQKQTAVMKLLKQHEPRQLARKSWRSNS
jgi:NAD(P)-dependent dehydrogenase (short-subunit alcohol dehydrogenase family)